MDSICVDCTAAGICSDHNASVNSSCTLPPPGNCRAFARLVSPGGGALANLARPGGRAFANPGDNPKSLSMVLKVCFLNFNMYFNLKRHNFKVNSDSVYKLSRFATGRI